ncbi:hypothetical protein INT45_003427 [Circinella minor]|uniref:Uncharacterized protein n=1 Tax=Circinella minor TaxID=1195481 RepID=A0A8H7S4V8_9FUNG|nr:hypothetical protein INT45_003427 [Circinella minor]
MAFYPATNLYPSPRPYQPGMIPPPLAAQPYTPTPPMGMNPFTPSSVDPLVMHSALQPPPPIISPPGGKT